MSRRYLRIAQKWFPIALSYFEDWPARPNCGHFFGGVHWYGIETAVPLHALAVVSTSPEYDEQATGLSLDELREVVIKAIRYLCFTHDTGPQDCVRPSKGLGMPNTWGTKWGERDRGFFPESQCGPTIANMTTAALMLRPYVDEETWLMLARICLDYLGRFDKMPPRSGIYADTQMEENAWTAHGLAACYLFLPGHEQAGAWEEHAKRWMFSACAAPQDRFNQGELEPDLTVSKLTGKTFTTLPDYMAENHGMVHPGYTASGVGSLGSLGSLYRLYGRTEPVQAHWNRQAVYDRIKLLTDRTGAAMPTQGMDRLFLSEQHALHAAAYLFLNDPDAGYFERVALEIREKTQESNGGRLIDPEIAAKCHEVEDPMEIKESEMISGIVHPYLKHRQMGAGAPEPTSQEEIERKFQGVRVFPHSGFAFHRHGKGQNSLAWRNYMMALPFTREGIHTVGPSRRSLLAGIQVQGHPDSHDLRVTRVVEKDEGFSALLVNRRAQGAVEQQVLFASLPNGDLLCRETLLALKDCTVEKLEQGFLRVMNEDFPLVEGNCNGSRVLYHPGGKEIFKGFPGTEAAEDVVFKLEHPGWLNVDDRLGIVFRGSGKTQYFNRHYFPPFSFRAVADDLILSLFDGARTVATGDVIGDLTLLICPEQAHGETPGRRLVQAASSEDTVCLITDEYMCAGNFGSRRKICAFEATFEGSVPVFSGTTRINGRVAEYLIPLASGESVYSKMAMSLLADGEVKGASMDGGGTFVRNMCDHAVRVRVFEDEKEEVLELGAKEVVEVQDVQ